MKKLFKLYKIFIVIIVAIFIFNCALEPTSDNGNITILTPNYAPISKSIGGVDIDEQLQEMQDRIRYEIGIEHEGKRIASVQLKNNDETTINVPAGIRLTIGVGIYLADFADKNTELWNSYLVSDVKTNVILMANETKYLDFTLDFSKPTKVESYHPPLLGAPGMNNAPGIGNITGGVIFPLLEEPVFSYVNLRTKTPKLVKYNIAGNFNNIPVTVDWFAPTGYGKLFEVKSPDFNKYWFIDNSNIFSNDCSTDNNFTSFLSYKDDKFKDFLRKVFSIKSVEYDGDYYYFLNYGNGMLTTKYDGDIFSWNQVSNIDFGNFSYIYPRLPFLLDVEQDTLPDNQNAFFVTKIGTFYVDNIALGLFADGNRKAGLERCRRIIRIPHPFDDRKSILITSVRVFDGTIFLGTRDGLYKIKKNSEWNNFKNKTITQFTVLSPDQIKKIADFNHEPIISMNLVGPVGNKILVVATPRRVQFRNKSGETDTITVWNGIPFIPLKSFTDAPSVDFIDHRLHDVSPIRFALWDKTNLRFWIGTKHGLCSIVLSDLF